MQLFKTLWANHPSNNGENAPCKDPKGNPSFTNQCSIRLGLALQASKMNFTSFKGARCWYGHKGHILRVEQLADWLRTQSHEVGTAISYKPGSTARSAVAGKTGILAVRNFYGSGNQGDHIDLWDGAGMAHGLAEYMDTAEEVLFWNIA